MGSPRGGNSSLGERALRYLNDERQAALKAGLYDAVEYRRDNGECRDCTKLGEPCDDHVVDAKVAQTYIDLAEWFGIDLEG